MNNITEKRDFFLAVLGIFAVLSIVDALYIKKQLNDIFLKHFEMSGENFVAVGVMEFINPTDKQHVFYPVYKKVDKWQNYTKYQD